MSIESLQLCSIVTITTPACGEVRGRVIRWPSGFQSDTLSAPLTSAAVHLLDSAGVRAPTSSRSTTGLDADGEFRLRLPTPSGRPVVPSVRALGYEPATVALDVARYPAFVVEVELRSSGMHDPQLGLSVHVVHGVRNCTP